MSRTIISGTGCALLDQIYPDVSFGSPVLQKYASKKPGDGGLSPGRLVFTEELEQFAGLAYDNILKEIIGNNLPATINLGGPSLVSLIHLSQLLDNNEFEIRFFGVAGEDRTGNNIFDLLKHTTLDISNYRQINGKPTSFTDVFFDPDFDHGHGERTFVNNIGAAWDYSPDSLSDDFYCSKIVCFGGTALVPQIHDHLHLLLSNAKKHDCFTIVNTVYDFRNERKFPGEKWPLGVDPNSLRIIDLLIMDREEALKISGKPSIKMATKYFIQKKIPAFVITNGANNIIAYSDGISFDKAGLIELPVSSKVTYELGTQLSKKGDTTGCGDNFAGGMIASIARQLKDKPECKLDLIEALAWAITSGGVACFYKGGTYFETTKGEKYNLVKIYYDEYIKQIGNS